LIRDTLSNSPSKGNWQRRFPIESSKAQCRAMVFGTSPMANGDMHMSTPSEMGDLWGGTNIFKDTIGRIEGLLSDASKKELDPSKAEMFLLLAQEQQRLGLPDRAEVYFNKSETIVSKLLGITPDLSEKKDVYTAFIHTESLLLGRVQFGVDVSEGKTLLDEAHELLRDEDLTQAHEKIEQADRVIKESKTLLPEPEAYKQMVEIRGWEKDWVPKTDEQTAGEGALAGVGMYNQSDVYEPGSDDETIVLKEGEEVKVISKEQKDLEMASTVSDAILEAQSFLAEAIIGGANVDEAQQALEEAEDLLFSGDYDSALELATKVAAMVKDQLVGQKGSDIEGALSATAESLKVAKESGLNVSEAEDLLQLAESMFEEQDFEAVAQYLDQASSSIDVVQEQHQDMTTSEALASTYGLVEEIEGLGIDMGDAESLLQQAEAMFADKDYDAAEKLIKEAESRAEESRSHFFKEMSSNAIISAKSSIVEAKEAGGNITEAEQILASSREALESNEFERAEELAIKSEEMAKKALELAKDSEEIGAVQKLIETSEDTLSDAKKVGVEEVALAEVTGFIDKAKIALESGDISTATDLAQKASAVAAERKDVHQKGQAESAIQSVKTLVEGVTVFGVDVSEAQDQIKNAEEALEEGDYDSIDSTVINVTKILDSLRAPYRTQLASNAIMSFQYKLSDAKEAGLDIDKAQSFIDEAKSQFDRGKFDEVEEAIKNADNWLSSVTYELNLSLVNKGMMMLDGLVGEVQSLGEDTSEGEKLLGDIRNAIAGNDLEGAKGQIKKAKPFLVEAKNKATEKVIRAAIDSANELIKQTVEAGADTKGAHVLAQKAEKFFASGDFPSAKKFASDAAVVASEARHELLKSLVSDSLSEARAQVRMLHELGANLSAPQKLLLSASSALKNGNYERAETQCKEAQQIMSSLRKPYMEKIVKKKMTEAVAAINDAKKVGANVKMAEKKLIRAQNLLSSGDLDGAEKEAKGTIETAIDFKQRFLKGLIDKDMKAAKQSIDQVLASGGRPAEAESFILSAQRFLGKGNQEQAKRYIMLAKEAAGEAQQHYIKEKTTDAMDYTRSLIGYLKKNIKGIDVKLVGAEKRLAQADQMFQYRRYNDAGKMADQGKAFIEGLKDEKVSQLLFVFESLHTEGILTTARTEIEKIGRAGVDISEALSLAQKARISFEDDSTKEEAKHYLAQAKTIAKEQQLMHQHKVCTEALAAARARILNAKMANKDIKKPQKLFKQAKTAYESREYPKSILFARKAKAAAEKL